MATMVQHPYVNEAAAILDGEPILRGTRTPVRAVVELWKFGLAPEEIVSHHPHLSLAQVFDALSFYQDHKAELEKLIQANRISDSELTVR